MTQKIAVILFNLGGPDKPESIRPFLFNLFNDPAIIRVPNPLRYLIAQMISRRREKTARAIYQQVGGRSPILPNTEKQAEALQKQLNQQDGENTYRCFVSMRYWHPFADETVADVKAFGPDRIILLPLYPQFSTTTTASSFEAWRDAADSASLRVPSQSLCCYPQMQGFVDALAIRIAKLYGEASTHGKPRLLLSAHGLPEKIVKAGDPYAWQCEQSATAVVQALNIPDLDWILCYQSRVGPLKWIGPATDDEVRRAASDRVPVIIAPLAFVSEHSETLVEIDIEYRHLAAQKGVPYYAYTGAVATDSSFIAGLAQQVIEAAQHRQQCTSNRKCRLCPAAFDDCITSDHPERVGV
ncbi:MAG: ferrochelatase [Alphaproteobacteria bacterium]|nr:ferrochelatase [Alphaproteobacteria bacterium]MBV8548079.1 ferrochelatase [Alphaproteobacteria bacterium]